MSNFHDSLEVLLHFEDTEYENDPDGGPTRYGITIPFLQDFYDKRRLDKVATVESIKGLTREEIRIIYREMLWDRWDYGEIIDSKTATTVFLAAVNLGFRPAHKIAQNALRAVGARVLVDGWIGPITLAAMNGCEPGEYAAALREGVAGEYRLIMRLKPAKERNRKGWERRAYWPN